jgi:hypothetical protein
MEIDLEKINSTSAHHKTYAKETRWPMAKILPHNVRFAMFVVMSGAAMSITRESSFRE